MYVCVFVRVCVCAWWLTTRQTSNTTDDNARAEFIVVYGLHNTATTHTPNTVNPRDRQMQHNRINTVASKFSFS